jgi:hypothetical protein
MIALPSFRPVIALFDAYATRVGSTLSAEQKFLRQEAAGTLDDLQYLVQEIITLNSSLVAHQDERAKAMLDSLRSAGDKDPQLAEFLRDNPNLQSSGISSVYGPGSEDLVPEQDREPLRELRLKTEQFYQLAHRLAKVIPLLPHLAAFEHKPIAIIRNQLIEHPEGKASKVLFDSFGFGTVTGPVVKALRVGTQVAPHADAGLYPNAIGLINALTKALTKAAEK